MKYLGSISDSKSHVTKEYVDDAIDKKADKDGVYPEMTVGMTRDMLGVGEGDEGEFLFRPTDGEGSIKDGFASIERIEGNSVVWNQMVNGVGSLTLINSHKYMTIIGGVAEVKTSIVTLDVAEGDRAYDLTQMFGARYEPTTVEEFYQRIPKGIDINAYNEGEVVNMNVQGIKSVGFNLWDGDATIEDNSNTPSYAVTMEESVLRTMKKIMLLSYQGNAIHYTCDVQGQIQGQHIGAMMLYKNGTLVAEILPNLGDICINLFADIEDVLNADSCIFYGTSLSKWKVSNICIHLVHTGYRNGEYEPHVSDEIALPIADYFPNGMNSIGNVKDELTATEAIQRIGVVDMGTLNWGLASTMFYVVDSIFFEGQKLLCVKYIHRAGYNNDKEFYSVGGVLRVVDLSYTDVASFKAAMSGVMLYYELAEPIVTSIDKPLALDYQVWDFGTEEAIAEGKTTPLKASIVYEFNARDTIRKNRYDIAKLNEELLQLKTTIGAGPYVLNATILDLDRAIEYYEGEQNITDLAEIRNALVNHRTIHIKYGSNYDGYFVVGGYIDGADMITLEFWYGLTQYSIEIDSTTQIGYVSQYDIVQ